MTTGGFVMLVIISKTLIDCKVMDVKSCNNAINPSIHRKVPTYCQ